MSDDYAIVVQGLKKSYKKLSVLNGIDFAVKKGSIFALLGPNGAGKTTTVKILSTLLHPTEGSATILGHDVVHDAQAVRSLIGLTGQYAAVDEYLTGEENMHMMGRLYRLSSTVTHARTNELLHLFDLVDASKRPVKTYSGGMRRRLDLAVSLIASPPVIFLDEPTTGLDPRSRLLMWQIIEQLATAGTTIFLTTQDMDEADHLADKIVVIDGGKVIAEGTSDELKRRVGSERLEVTVTDAKSFAIARKIMQAKDLRLDEKNLTISVPTAKGVHQLKDIITQLEKARVKVDTVSIHRPTLDDVFLTFTGHAATKEGGSV